MSEQPTPLPLTRARTKPQPPPLLPCCSLLECIMLSISRPRFFYGLSVFLVFVGWAVFFYSVAWSKNFYRIFHSIRTDTNASAPTLSPDPVLLVLKSNFPLSAKDAVPGILIMLAQLGLMIRIAPEPMQSQMLDNGPPLACCGRNTIRNTYIIGMTMFGLILGGMPLFLSYSLVGYSPNDQVLDNTTLDMLMTAPFLMFIYNIILALGVASAVVGQELTAMRSSNRGNTGGSGAFNIL